MKVETVTIEQRQSLGVQSAADLARLVVVLVVGVLLQTTVAPFVRILGANPDFVLILVVCVGLLRGAEWGVGFGFVAGALVSLILFEPLGVSSFIFVLLGYLAGRYAETADLSSGFAPIFMVFSASLLGQILFALVQFLLARQVPFAYVVLSVIIPSVILDTLLAAPVYLLARLWLRGGGARRALAAR
jgi:rod shape-determining protein MreD